MFHVLIDSSFCIIQLTSNVCGKCFEHLLSYTKCTNIKTLILSSITKDYHVCRVRSIADCYSVDLMVTL